jgi:poly-gamma-glutamate capsule biosynthesis protein CapA/YwtB (metallophosphatase superfamily)
MQPTPITLFLCGDVMTGRGIDQILGHPGDPRLYEDHVRSARIYVDIAERVSGAIPRTVGPGYIWGDALAELDRRRPDARIVNLETAITAAGEPWPGKGIHYRMHPANLACLTAAKIDCAVLANNHVLDWGRGALADTVATLRAAGLSTAGAGADAHEAMAPAVLELAGGARVLVFACATADSGVAPEWAAGPSGSGVNLLDDLGDRSADAIAERIRAVAREGDLTVLSIHWGANWGYRVGGAERSFAHRLIDSGAVHVVHGHSSHHPRPIEVYRERLILYGCGDLINDYEGISGHESFRPELALMYFPTFEPAGGRLLRVALVPMRLRRFRLERARSEEARWLETTLDRECRPFRTRVRREPDGEMVVGWGGEAHRAAGG